MNLKARPSRNQPATYQSAIAPLTPRSLSRTSRTNMTASIVFICLMPVSSFAADKDNAKDTVVLLQQFDQARYGDFRDQLNEWQVTIGAGALLAPEYEGSDKFDVKPLPLLTAKFGDRVSLDPTGISIDAIQWNGLRFGITGGYEIGRKENDSHYLRGLGDVDAGGVIGGIASYDLGPFQAYATLNKTIGGSEGLTSTFGARASTQYDRFLISADVYGTWADDKHMESYFSITSTQAARSGLQEYDAKAGVKRVDFKASVTYVITENWLVTMAGGVGMLTGDARDSPVVKEDVQPFGVLGVSYRF